jgi:hypothetical protein
VRSREGALALVHWAELAQHERVTIASFTLKTCCLVMLFAATGLAVAQADRSDEASQAAWLAKQPAATQRALRAQMREWKTCSAAFDQRSAAAEAATAAQLSSPKFYKITTGGVVLSSSAPGLCPSRTGIFPGDTRLTELDARNSNPGDGMVMWYGARQACFAAATRFAERFNRELARLRPTVAKAICSEKTVY